MSVTQGGDNDDIDNISMMGMDNGRLGNPRALQQMQRVTSDDDNHDASEASPSRNSSGRWSLGCICKSISSLAIPLLVLLFLLLPTMLVIILLIVFCIIPVALTMCLACTLYVLAPETRSTFTLLWGSGISQRRWGDMDWTHTNMMEEPRSREELEKLLKIKKIVSSNLEDGSTAECQEEDRTPKVDTPEPENEEKSKDDPRERIEQNEGGPDKSEEIEECETKGENNIDVELGNISTTSSLSTVAATKNESSIPETYHLDHDTSCILINNIPKPCCDICMMDYEVGDLISESKNPDCDHIFHKDCILDWMQKKHTCPCCRRNYLGEEEEPPDIISQAWRESQTI